MASPAKAPVQGMEAALRAITRSLRHGASGGAFLEILAQEADCVRQAAILVRPGAEPAGARVRELQGRAAALDRTLTSRLKESSFSPLSHEDVRSISACLNRTLLALARVEALPERGAPVWTRELWALSSECARELAPAVEALPEPGAQNERIVDRSRQAAALVRAIETDLAAGEPDAILLLRGRHAGLAVRGLFGRYRAAANLLSYAVLKSG